MGTSFTIAQQNHVLLALSQGWSIARIADTLQRRPRTIQRLLQKLADGAEEVVDAQLPAQHIVEDRRFKKAMLRAINRGLEHPYIGVIVDTSPLSPYTRYYAPVHGSICGSPAAVCADAGDNPGGDHEVHWR
jgi:hypothetical protein